MCGICGIVNLDDSDASDHVEAVERMCQAMRHRGPDDQAVETIGAACIGQRRLSIIDISSRGRQPFVSVAKDVCLSANGEIYNFKSYRADLKKAGCIFQSSSDSEVILHGYKVDGIAVTNKLRGMFAFAIFDKANRLTFLARDRQGIKPLYYHLDEKHLIFASDLLAIIRSGLIESRLNYTALDQYLVFGVVPEPNTLIRGIKMLPPAHRLIAQGGKAKIQPYWQWPQPSRDVFNIHSSRKDIRYLLEDSVKVHLQSDVPLGVFLSGGIDSTVVAILAAKNTSLPLQTFSIGFEDGKKCLDERSTARTTAEILQTDHHEIVLAGWQVENEFLNIISHMQQPSFDGINSYFISKVTREAGIKVALSGLGGDELFGGYETYKYLPRWGNFVGLWRSMPLALKRHILGIIKYCARNPYRREKILRLADVFSFTDLYALVRANGWPQAHESLYSRNFLQQSRINIAGENPLSCLHGIAGVGNYWQKTQKLEMTNYMTWRLLRDTDAMSMAHSLEVRVPLIDDNLVDYVLALPAGWHKASGWPKKLLVDSMRDLLPEHILDRPKQGFQLPMDVWMKGRLKPLIEHAFSKKKIRERGIFNENALIALWQQFESDKLPYEYVWKFVALELWMQNAGI